ncbi:hypothetical protein DPMN_127664 [Dreissena polymorpha]|uniref:Uncharacterized protein n=1 Tax=Dreissena polymorpha TaxID=45954 RepID=A0A9D4JWP9_DREPO|nr:hypothetical protein DPMN_127664 [Dreissena polymorpha]
MLYSEVCCRGGQVNDAAEKYSGNGCEKETRNWMLRKRDAFKVCCRGGQVNSAKEGRKGMLQKLIWSERFYRMRAAMRTKNCGRRDTMKLEVLKREGCNEMRSAIEVPQWCDATGNKGVTVHDFIVEEYGRRKTTTGEAWYGLGLGLVLGPKPNPNPNPTPNPNPYPNPFLGLSPLTMPRPL